MEQAVFDRLVYDWGKTPVADFANIRETLTRFNLTGKNEYEGYLRTHTRPETPAAYALRKQNEIEAKINILNSKLQELGLGDFNSTYSDRAGNVFSTRYNVGDAAQNRQQNLRGLIHGTPDEFSNILLPSDRK